MCDISRLRVKKQTQHILFASSVVIFGEITKSTFQWSYVTDYSIKLLLLIEPVKSV